MPYDFHGDTDLYFDQQRENAHASILPFLDGHLAAGSRVLEIGCGAGGVLKAFEERGARVTGVDLHEPSVDYARRRFAADADIQQDRRQGAGDQPRKRGVARQRRDHSPDGAEHQRDDP